MGIIGHDHGQSGLPGDSGNTLVDSTLFRDAMILQFQIEIIFSEDFSQFQGIRLGCIVVLFHQPLRNGTCQTGRRCNQAFMVLTKHCKIHTGFAVESIHERLRYQQAQILVSLPVLTQQNQMIRVIVHTVNAVGNGTAGHIDLTADNRFDTGCFCRLIKVNTAVHNAVIRDGNGGLSQFLYPVHHAADAACSVQEAVFRMNMQMYKTHFSASFAI